MREFADSYAIQGKYDLAEPLYRRSLEIQEQFLGPDHPELLELLDSYAGLVQELGSAEEAEKHETWAERIRTEMQRKGEEHE